MSAQLDDFIQAARDCAQRHREPVDCVQAIAPLMSHLLGRADDFLQSGHLRSDPEHYARNAILVSPDASLALYALVWLPGQWTPVHDHGSWGVVGVLRGMLHERSYIRLDHGHEGDQNIELARGGVFMFSPGTISSFVPNPDHIHVTGVPRERQRVVSLHLYGRMMNSFNTYDVAAGTRQRVNVEHNES